MRRPCQVRSCKTPTVASVIVGARNEEQLRQNLGAVGWNLTREQVAKLDAAERTALGLPILASSPVRRLEPSANSTLKGLNGSRERRHSSCKPRGS